MTKTVKHTNLNSHPAALANEILTDYETLYTTLSLSQLKITIEKKHLKRSKSRVVQIDDCPWYQRLSECFERDCKFAYSSNSLATDELYMQEFNAGNTFLVQDVCKGRAAVDRAANSSREARALLMAMNSLNRRRSSDTLTSLTAAHKIVSRSPLNTSKTTTSAYIDVITY